MVSRSAVFHNARIKAHLDGSFEVLVASVPLFREAGWEECDFDSNSPKKSRKKVVSGENENLERAKRRARTMLRDYALNTDFRFFVTLTLDASKIDRYDPVVVVKSLSTWCDNRVRRKGLAYVLVPEEHKDGAIHFHGFFNDALPVADSGTMIPPGGGKPRKPRSKAQAASWASDGGRVVYNLPAWSLGFSTAIELYGDRFAAVGYVCKYITKAQQKIGGRWYYSGGNLGRPDVVCLDLDIDQVCAGRDVHRFEVPGVSGVTFFSFRVMPGEPFDLG